MPKSSDCENWLCNTCTDKDCDHFCHQQKSEDKKLVEV